MTNKDLLEEELERFYQPAALPEGFESSWRAAVRREEIKMTNQKKKKNVFWKIAAPVAAAVVLAVGAIGASNFMPVKTAAPSTIYYETDSAVYGNSSVNGGAFLTMAAKTGSRDSAAGVPMEEAAYDSAASYNEVPEYAAADVEEADASGSTLWNRNETGDRKLVRSASVTVKTTAFEDDLKALESLITEMGGYLESFWQSGDAANGRLRSAELVIRVPADRLDAFLSGAGGIGRVTERSESASDMTTVYYDNETRLNTLRAKMTRLTELLGQAKSMKDILEIEREISDTQYQIDSFETSQRSIDSSVSMSTVSLSLKEEKAAQIAQTEEITFGKRILSAFAAGGAAFAGFLSNLLVFLALALPFLAILAVIAVAAVLIIRARRARARKAAEEPAAEETEEKEE